MQVNNVSLFGPHTEEELDRIGLLSWGLLGCTMSSDGLFGNATGITRMAIQDNVAGKLKNAVSKGVNSVKATIRSIQSSARGTIIDPHTYQGGTASSGPLPMNLQFFGEGG